MPERCIRTIIIILRCIRSERDGRGGYHIGDRRSNRRGLIGYFLPSVLPAVTQGVGFTLPKLIMQGGQLAYTATTVVVSEKIIFQIFATGLTAAELTANILYYQSKKKGTDDTL